MAEKFTWNFSNIDPECLYSEYKKVRIGIEGVYAYGTGYLIDKTAFEMNILYMTIVKSQSLRFQIS